MTIIRRSKICFKCHKRKILSSFYKHKMMGDGHLNKCKSCTKKDVNERYIKEFDKIREYEARRFKTPSRKSKVLEAAKKRDKRFPGKARARSAVSRALRDGRLKRMPCIHCGDKNTQGHHDDYRKKLEVKWVCFLCHRTIEHGQLKHYIGTTVKETKQ